MFVLNSEKKIPVLSQNADEKITKFEEITQKLRKVYYNSQVTRSGYWKLR